MTKAAIVIQRYGREIVGGAESLCRQIAERLVSDLGWSVTVYTTYADDYVTWKNTDKPPREQINGVLVKRYKSWFPRSSHIFGLINQKFTPYILRFANGIRLKKLVGYALERVWLILQGPYCPGLVTAVKREVHHYDKVFIFTYLYYPSLLTAKSLKGKCFTLIPLAHNEPPFYFRHMKDLLDEAAQILVNIEPEKRLIENRIGRSMDSIRLGGLGFDAPPIVRGPEKPGRYLVYLGRICEAKGVRFLIESFLEYIGENPASDLKLQLVGKKDDSFEIPESDRIEYMGFVTDATKFSLIASSLCVVNPSRFESLSMIAIEAMVCHKPILVNSASEVLAFYAEQVATCFGFQGTNEFINQLKHIETIDWNSKDSQDRLSEASLWAEAHYSWPSVLKAYQDSPCHTPQMNKVPAQSCHREALTRQ
jgi:glycosyltransferase involved in cell wall biosynthesis